MYTKAEIAKHPIHPMLVAFPVAFYTATLVAFIAYAVNGNPFWFHVGFVANVAGVVMALAAAVPGFIDWAFGIPTGSPAKTTGMFHMLANVAALVLFALNILLTRHQWGAAQPALGRAIVLPVFGMVLTLVAGWLGWKMVQTHHVGIELTPEQQRHEPRANAREPRSTPSWPDLPHARY